MSVLQSTIYPAELVAEQDLTGATVTLTVTAPNGTVTTPTVTVSGSTATAPVPALQIGTYLLIWAVSGTVSGGVQDQFTVDPASIDLVSLGDLREDLNLSDTSKDPKLRRWLKAATGVVENVTGPIRAQPTTTWFDGGTPTLILPARWVSAITSVTEQNGSALTVLPEYLYGSPGLAAGGYTWDRVTNILTRRTGGGILARFTGGARSVQVVYTAGLTTIPDEIQLATIELIRHWYRKNETGFRSAPFPGAADDGVQMVGSYMVPNAVMELLEPWRRLPELA